eukprot:scaffold7123_cov134-Skeletonema_menzelii.AAC.2
MSSSRPKSKIADGGLLTEAVFSSDALLCDIIDEESLMAGGAALFIRAAMPVGSMRRSRGDRSAKPDADGRLVAIIATMAKMLAFDFMGEKLSEESEWLLATVVH